MLAVALVSSWVIGKGFLKKCYMLQKQLFDTEPRCSICKQKIHRLQNAHVDHIIPFAKGGPTEASNAQLTHASCNQQKGARNHGIADAPKEAAWYQSNGCSKP